MRDKKARGLPLTVMAVVTLVSGWAQAQEAAPTAPGSAAPAGRTTPTSSTAAPAGVGSDVTAPKENPSAPPPSAGEPAPPPSPPPAGPSYTEPPPVGGAPVPPPQAVTTVQGPPPPGYGPVYEPPPPPEPEHVAPKFALWAGARASFWVPFGSLWGRCTVYDAYGCLEVTTVPFRDFVGSGGALEADVGARLGRAYTVYVGWEHAELQGGQAEFELTDEDGAVTEMSPSRRARTDLFGLGVRFSSNPDRVGLLVDMLIGYRTLTAHWDTGDASAPERLVMTQAPFEFRFGAGADIRLHPSFSLSPLATVGSGVFRAIEWELGDGTRVEAPASNEDFFAHGWFTIGLGGHFDLLGVE